MKIKILPGLHDPSRKRNLTGWQKMTPLQKLRRNHEKNDYYRPVFKQESSTIRRGSDQIGLKNNLGRLNLKIRLTSSPPPMELPSTLSKPIEIEYKNIKKTGYK